MTATLRGSKRHGYRTTTGVECPHCQREFHLAGQAYEDAQGPHLVLYPSDPEPVEYSEADIARIYAPERLTAAQTGVQLPVKLGKTRMVDDPVPDFTGARGT